MNIVILCNKFPLSSDSSWLTSDLAVALKGKGHQIFVCCLEWNGSGERRLYDYAGIQVANYPAPKPSSQVLQKLGTLWKWFFLSRASLSYFKKVLPFNKVDLVIDFSPSYTTRGLFKWLKRDYQPKTYLVLWDFFPIYHSELGLVPKALFKIFKTTENSLYNRHDVIGLMSPTNIDFIRRHYSISNSVRLNVLPLWGPGGISESKATTTTKNHNEVICVFGGQLIPGRGLEHVLDLAISVRDELPQVKFLIAGEGPLRETIEVRIREEEVSNVELLGQLSRDSYLRLLSGADIGLVFNSGHVSVPTFPSKSIDYMRAGLPMLGAVERATDFGEILENEIEGGLSSATDEKTKIRENLKTLVLNPELRKEMGQRGQQYFLAKMTADAVASELLSQAGL